MEPTPTTGEYRIMDYIVPQGGLPLEIRRGIVQIAQKYSPVRVSASAVILEGERRLGVNTFMESALRGFNEGEVINFETNEPSRINEIKKDLESLLKL